MSSPSPEEIDRLEIEEALRMLKIKLNLQTNRQVLRALVQHYDATLLQLAARKVRMKRQP